LLLYFLSFHQLHYLLIPEILQLLYYSGDCLLLHLLFLEDGTPGFTQLQEIKDEVKGNLQNSTVVEGFQELVGNVTDEMRENITTKITETFSDV